MVQALLPQNRTNFSFTPLQNLADIITEYDLILVDTCFFTPQTDSPHFDLARVLYDATTYNKLSKLLPDLERVQGHLQWLEDLFKDQPHIQIIPETRDEMRYLTSHFGNAYSYHTCLWKFLTKKSISGKFKSPHKRELYIIRGIQRHNEQVARLRQYIQEDDPSQDFPYEIQLLHVLEQKTQRNNLIPQYTKTIVSIESVGKASIVDCTLLGAAIGYATTEIVHSRTAILTNDYDLPQLLEHHLGKVSPTEADYLARSVHIFMKLHLSTPYVRRVVL